MAKLVRVISLDVRLDNNRIVTVDVDDLQPTMYMIGEEEYHGMLFVIDDKYFVIPPFYEWITEVLVK